MILNVFKTGINTVSFLPVFLSCVLGVFNSLVLTPAQGLLGHTQWRSKGGGPGGSGRHFADQKLILERCLKVIVFHYYFKCSTAFQISCLEALDW